MMWHLIPKPLWKSTQLQFLSHYYGRQLNRATKPGRGALRSKIAEVDKELQRRAREVELNKSHPSVENTTH